MKFFLIIWLSFLVVGCGMFCSSEPPRRAIIEGNGGYGMQYHFILYNPLGDAKHNTPELKCIKYRYATSHIYTDSLGSQNGSSIIWKSSQDFEMISQNVLDSAYFVFGDETIQISGLKGSDEYYNGTWKIEKSSPDSWGVPIIKSKN